MLGVGIEMVEGEEGGGDGKGGWVKGKDGGQGTRVMFRIVGGLDEPEGDAIAGRFG